MNVEDGRNGAALTRRVGADEERRSTRRAFIFAVASWSALAWLDELRAQSKKPAVIGWLATGGTGPTLAAFKEGLSALGWKEGSEVVFETRSAKGRSDQLPVLAAELAAKKPKVIVSTSGVTTRILAEAAPNIPIVQATGSDPVAAGHAASLARPGGMVTGLTTLPTELRDKYVELLVAIIPKLKRVGVLIDGNLRDPSRQREAARRSAAHYSIEALFAQAAKAEDIEPAMSSLARQGAQALIAMPSPFLNAERQRVIKIALAQRWPLISESRRWAEEGALLSYGVDFLANFHRAAYYVDRILKGAKPGDLPIEQPMKIELAVNAKTAKALGLGIPQELLLRADRVIE
jgi:putative ABC transport system substrate-binding protein